METIYFQTDRESSKLKVLSLIELDDVVKEVQLVVKQDVITLESSSTRKLRQAQDNGHLQALIVSDNLQTLTAYKRNFEKEFKTPTRSALYLPLVNNNIVLPHPDKPWDAEAFKSMVRENLSEENLHRLNRMLQSRKTRRDFLILGVPRPNYTGDGRYGPVGVAIMRSKKALDSSHLLSESSCGSSYQISMRDVLRQDWQFIMRRGGSDTSLADKRVLLLGVGSLGGHLAQMLAAAGVGNLTLVDNDTLSIGNIFRHILGRGYVGSLKVEGLRFWLEDHYPYLKVIPEKIRATSLFQRYGFDITSYDLIVDATANSTNHLTLAQYLKNYADRPPLIATWLDPLGIGGHVIVNFGGNSGCLRCLYSDLTHSLHNLASFAAPDQDFGADAIGCGSYFTAFSDLDAVRTSELATRKAVDILHEKSSQNFAYSWKGNSDAFLAAGFQLAPRFGNSVDKSFSIGVTYAHADCDNCREAD